MSTTNGLQMFEYLVERPGRFVAAFLNQGIEDIGNGHNAGKRMNGVAAEALGIAAAVKFLMMLMRDGGGCFQDRAL